MPPEERCGTCRFRHTNGKCKESHGKVRGDYDWCNAWTWDKINRPPTVQEQEFIDAPPIEEKTEDKPMLRESPELNLDYLKKNLPTPKEPDIKIESGPPTEGLFEKAFDGPGPNRGAEPKTYPEWKGKKPNYRPLKVVEYKSMDGLVEILHVNGMRIDPDILEFTIAMQEAFNSKKIHKGDSWRALPFRILELKLTKQVLTKADAAYIRDFETNKNGRTKLLEYSEVMVKIGNYAWMLWKRARGEEE